MQNIDYDETSRVNEILENIMHRNMSLKMDPKQYLEHHMNADEYIELHELTSRKQYLYLALDSYNETIKYSTAAGDLKSLNRCLADRNILYCTMKQPKMVGQGFIEIDRHPISGSKLVDEYLKNVKYYLLGSDEVFNEVKRLISAGELPNDFVESPTIGDLVANHI